MPEYKYLFYKTRELYLKNQNVIKKLIDENENLKDKLKRTVCQAECFRYKQYLEILEENERLRNLKVITNYDKIKSMNIDELAEFCSVFQRCEFCSMSVHGTVNMDECRKTTCKEAIKKWLEAKIEKG